MPYMVKYVHPPHTQDAQICWENFAIKMHHPCGTANRILPMPLYRTQRRENAVATLNPHVAGLRPTYMCMYCFTSDVVLFYACYGDRLERVYRQIIHCRGGLKLVNFVVVRPLSYSHAKPGYRNGTEAIPPSAVVKMFNGRNRNMSYRTLSEKRFFFFFQYQGGLHIHVSSTH